MGAKPNNIVAAGVIQSLQAALFSLLWVFAIEGVELRVIDLQRMVQ